MQQATQSNLSITPSSASLGALKKVVQRMGLQMIVGLPFRKLPSPIPSLGAFSWQGANEADGYVRAVAWLNEHVCPPGITAVLKHQNRWLEW
jgi:hypothetical protein